MALILDSLDVILLIFLVVHLLYYDVAIYHLELHSQSFMKALDKNKHILIL